MRNINLRYARETYDEQGVLSALKLEYPDDFNWAYDVVDDIATAEPERPAMVWCNEAGEEHRFGFGDVKHWSDKTANMLLDAGVRRGDRVLVILRRHYQFWFVATALHKIGAVMVPATFMLKEHDLAYRIEKAQVKAIVCTATGFIADVVDSVMAAHAAEEPYASLVRILVQGEGTCEQSGSAGICTLPAERAGWLDFNTLASAASADFAPVRGKVTDPFLIYFSSGTSGNPKMVLHNGSYALGHLPTAKYWHGVVSDGGLHFTIADTGWGKAVWGKFYGQWLMEACVFTFDFDRFDGAQILQHIQDYGVTTLCCPPTMYRLMMQEDVDAYDLSSLVRTTTAGEALNPDLFESWRAHTGLCIAEGFGQTETPLIVATLLNMSSKTSSMGRPVPLFEVQIRSEEDEPCRPGQTGEICIKVPECSSYRRALAAGETWPAGIMNAYWGDPEKTAEAVRDGWYHTGDTAWYDEDGYYFYVGRNDDVIKSSGYRIGPFEIESVLLEHDAVRECAITGIPDEVRGKVVKATVVLADGFEASPELTKELQRWVKERTAPYKYPRVVDYVEELPKTVNGKIRRSAIRDK